MQNLVIRTFILLLFGLVPAFSQHAWAAGTACSNVALEILQEATTERVAFDAKLVLTNNIPDKDLTSLRVDVTVKDKDGNIRNDLFFMKVSSMRNITGVDGTGTVPSASNAEVHWLIIPSVGAGGQDAAGIAYWVGATLTYTIAGRQEVVSVNPDRISVKPMPQLVLDYFMPRSVIGDNPFTNQVEAPVPFPLALRVLNNGAGPAYKLKIDSAQPRIVANDQGLLVDFKLLGAVVNDSLATPSLTVNVGDLASKNIATASWEMISTLTGVFEGFDVSFSHSADLGGELTSLITETNAHYLVHSMRVNLPGRDSRLDFLADTDRDAEHLPDAIFESEIPNGSGDGADSVASVSSAPLIAQPGRPTSASPQVSVHVDPNVSGWIFARFDDPSQGMLSLLDVVRGDGVRLDGNNYWVEEGVDSDYRKTYTAWFVDYRPDAAGSYEYTLHFSQPSADGMAPLTSINFDGPATGESPFYITPETKVFFTASDNAGGSGIEQIFKKLSGSDADFVPAYPFNITAPGSHSVEYYSVDRAGNVEEAKTATLIIDENPPVITSFQAAPSTFTPHAPIGVSAARETTFSANISDDVGSLPLTLEIASVNDFSAGSIVRTFSGTAVEGIDFNLEWDGRNSNGKLVPAGTYHARITVSDGLGSSASHSSSALTTVEVADWFDGEPLDPNLTGAQMYPSASGSNAVWQDQRNGDWDVYTMSLSGGQSRGLTSGAGDQIRPRIDGDIVVWQDNRNGNWDIYGYDLLAGQTLTIDVEPGNQERPYVSNGWVAWQGNSGGNWDIFAKNLSTAEIIQVTTHERDQINPVISGGAVYWEDYRHGLGEIYRFDLAARTESRITVNASNQTTPWASGTGVVWTDQRNSGSGKDLYFHDPATGEKRVTFGDWDEKDPKLVNDVMVYVDNENGMDNPDLSFYDLGAGHGGKLTANPFKQEEPALTGAAVLWQDDRDGIYQIYRAALSVTPAQVTFEIRPGMNLVAAGNRLATDYPTASALLNANPEFEKVMSFSGLHKTYSEASASGGDFGISAGDALIVYASSSKKIQIADSGETARYTLLPGENHIGILSVPAAYTAHALINSIGLDNIKSVRRFDALSGLWQTVSVRDNSGVMEIVGANFAINPGDGLILNLSNRVDDWAP